MEKNSLKSKEIVILPEWRPMFVKQALENIYNVLLVMEEAENEK